MTIAINFNVILLEVTTPGPPHWISEQAGNNYRFLFFTMELPGTDIISHQTYLKLLTFPGLNFQKLQCPVKRANTCNGIQ